MTFTKIQQAVSFEQQQQQQHNSTCTI